MDGYGFMNYVAWELVSDDFGGFYFEGFSAGDPEEDEDFEEI